MVTLSIFPFTFIIFGYNLSWPGVEEKEQMINGGYINNVDFITASFTHSKENDKYVVKNR